MHFTSLALSVLSAIVAVQARVATPEELQSLEKLYKENKDHDQELEKRFIIAELSTHAERDCGLGAQVFLIDSSENHIPFGIPLSQGLSVTNVPSGCQILACFAGFSCFDQSVGTRILEPNVCELKNQNDGFNFDKILAQCN
ncbi:hypothetical protein NM208_g6844 [Fusarium decemcellulare]|uniref:Uncharacterized protein n=1 Tax=Fusarium decemcellulare TaxID=57161 RepID=A0ACC1SBI3_9HYPO|nr:hypothetical protein NM208_g6844 [Fusarium decemcellulare]